VILGLHSVAIAQIFDWSFHAITQNLRAGHETHHIG